MNTKRTIFFLILAFLISVVAIVYINNLISRLNKSEMTRSLYQITQTERNKTNTALLSSRVFLTILKVEDYYETDLSTLKKEVHLSFLENIKQDSESYCPLSQGFDVDVINSVSVYIGVDQTHSSSPLFSQITKSFSLVRQKKYSQAIPEFNSILESSKDEAIVIPSLIYRAYSFFKLGNYFLAEKDLDDARAFNSYSFNGIIQDLRKKLATITKLKTLVCDNPLQKAILDFKCGDYEIAKKELLDLFNAQSKIEKKYDVAYYLARIEEEQGNYEIAKKLFSVIAEKKTPFAKPSLIRSFIIKKYLTNEVITTEKDILLKLEPKLLPILNVGDSQTSTLLSSFLEKEDSSNTTSISEAEIPSIILTLNKTATPYTYISKSTPSPVLALNTPYPSITAIPIDKVAIKKEIDILEEEKVSVTNELKGIQSWEFIKGVSEVSVTSGAVASLGVASYYGYQAFQLYQAYSSSINPSTVSSIRTEFNSTIISFAISGGISVALWITGGGLAMFDGKDKDKKKAKDLQDVIDELSKSIDEKTKKLN